MKKAIISIVLFFTLFAAYSTPVDSLWVQANKAYTESDFENASKKYEEILATGVDSPELYFNLGNAYFKQNMLGQSILNYERALRLSPENADIINNLEMARLTQLDKTDILPDFVLSKWYNSALRLVSVDGWGVISIVLFAMFLILLLIYFFTRRYGLRKLAFFTSAFILLLCFIAVFFAQQQQANLTDDSHAIIFSPVVTVKSSPDTNGNDLFIIHEGLKVKVIDQIGEWNRIMLSDGKQGGWVPAESMQRI